jgi:hypothetical protein
MRRLLLLLWSMPLFSVSAATPADAVSLRVNFTLSDADGKPIPQAEVRLVFGREQGWQRPEAGHRFVTDANGAHTLELPVRLEQRSTKRPTNFIDGLLRRAEPTDYLHVAAELTYAGHRWLYGVEIHHFRRDGLAMFAGLVVFTRDERGAFTRKAKVTKDGWWMEDLGGWVLTGPGHDVRDFTLRPEAVSADERHWTLSLSFQRAPEPVRR